LIKKLDVPIRQVSIEARIVRAQDSAAESLGVRWGWHASDTHASNNVGTVTTGNYLSNVEKRSGAVTFTATEGGGIPVKESATGVDLGVAGATSAFTIGLVDVDKFNVLQMELSAMQSIGQTQIVSQPKVVTQDKKEAIIKSGTKIPYQTTSDKGTETKFEDAVLGLTVTPYITPNDRILMDILLTKDSVGKIFNDAISIDVTSIETEIMVDNGQTAVIGGIFEESQVNEVAKVPFLGDLPFVGRIFRRTLDDNTKTELLIFLTPRIMSDPLARD
jgi:type IV pilus assembly protein PilQ